MVGCPEITPGLDIRSKGDLAGPQVSLEELCQQQMRDGLAKMHRELEAEKRKKSMQYFASLWPIAAGLVLACVVPILTDVLEPLGQWAIGIVFPFAVLSMRPELHMGTSIATGVPQMILYGQFPVEGLLARSGSKGRVTVSAVVGRVAFLQLMGGVLLLLLNIR